ncbi:hypothetical protein PV04_08661 [Phialophora macrospora]|uniref:Uncharacterized protein n=1 Tax=Phialophora macrospora TaxID=1851006 RepID=A0A0D2F6U3_9EURO|nr:hypothetical protein PV04_08661 [Phialophora macrospora]
MDRTAARRQAKSTRKFIQQDPTSSQYNGRIRKDEKATLEALLLALHGTGASREQMLAACNAVLGTPITLAQLDRQRAKLNLHKFRRQQPGPLSQPQCPDGIAPAPYNEEHLDSTGPELESESMRVRPGNQRRHMNTQDTPRVEPSAHPSDTEMLGDDLDDHHDAVPQPRALTALGSIDIDCPATKETPEASLELSPSDAVPVTNGRLPKPLGSDMDSHPNPARLGVKFRFKLGGTLFEELIYHIHSVSLARIYLERLNGGAPTKDITQLVQIAMLLYTLGALDQAFDAFCLLFRHFNSEFVNARILYMRFAAIACVETARTPLQVRAARLMSRLVLRYPKATNLCPCTRKRASHVLADLDRGLEEVVGDGGLRSPPGFGEIIFKTFAALGLSHSEHMELWDISCLRRSFPDPLHFVLDEGIPGTLFLDGLKIALSIIGQHLHELDALTKDAWELFDLTAAQSIARTLACTVLREYARNSATREALAGQFPDWHSFHVRLKSVAIALAPFVLVRETGQVKSMVEFFQAAKQYQRGVESSQARLDTFEQSCRLQLSTLASEWSYNALGLSSGDVVEICASAAGMGFPDDDPLAGITSLSFQKGAPSVDEGPLRKVESPEHAHPQFPILPPPWSELTLLEQMPAQPPTLLPALSEVEPLGQTSAQSSVLAPVLTRRYSPSNSSSLRSFVSPVHRVRGKGTWLSDDGHWQDGTSESGTSHSSWRLDFMSVASSSTLSTRRNGLTTLSDVEMME